MHSPLRVGGPPSAVIVDDSSISRIFLRAALTSLGVNVVAEGAEGPDGLSLYERWRPTLMFLDLVLPGINGIDVANQILAAQPHALVVICSAFATREQVVACHRAGVAGFLLKPLTADKCADLLTKLLVQAAA